MRIPFLHFHEAIVDWLHTLFFQGECVGYQQIGVSNVYATSIYPPLTAQYAMIVIESDPSQIDKQLVIRFTESGVDPGFAYGMPMGHLGVYECKGKENMAALRLIGIEFGKYHMIHIQYFG